MTDSYHLKNYNVKKTTFAARAKTQTTVKFRIIDPKQLWPPVVKKYRATLGLLCPPRLVFFNLSHHGIPSEEINARLDWSPSVSLIFSETIKGSNTPDQKGVFTAGWKPKPNLRHRQHKRPERILPKSPNITMRQLWSKPKKNCPAFEPILRFLKNILGWKYCSSLPDKLALIEDFFSKSTRTRIANRLPKAPCVYCIIFSDWRRNAEPGNNLARRRSHRLWLFDLLFPTRRPRAYSVPRSGIQQVNAGPIFTRCRMLSPQPLATC